MMERSRMVGSEIQLFSPGFNGKAGFSKKTLILHKTFVKYTFAVIAPVHIFVLFTYYVSFTNINLKFVFLLSHRCNHEFFTSMNLVTCKNIERGYHKIPIFILFLIQKTLRFTFFNSSLSYLQTFHCFNREKKQLQKLFQMLIL